MLLPKTPDSMKTTNSISPRLSSCCLAALVGVVLILGKSTALGSDATWNLNPIDNIWNNPLNWTPNTVPGVGNTATFSGSDITDITFSQTALVDEILFSPGASAFTLTVSHNDVLLFDSALGIVNNSGITQNFISSVDENDEAAGISFSDHSSAGSQTAFTIGARETSSGVNGAAQFLEFGSADHGTFLNQASSIADPMGAQSVFFSNSTAASGVFINEGAVVNGAGGGATIFYNQTNAGAATLIARGGSNGGGGGQIKFFDSSKGGTARVEVFGNGFLDVSDHGAITLGSIEGDGLILLAQSKLTAGGNGLSTIFSGIMKEGGASGGSFAKAGAGTLTLSGASLYTGGTTISAGTLVASNTSGSATGTGSVSVNAGTLGGSGIIAGAVTVGTGSGTGAFLAPAHGGNKQLTLTIQGGLTFNSDSTYTYTFKAKRNKSKTDKVVANGVTINSGASFNLSGTAQGTLTQGTVLTVIKNTAATPVSGTFSNLPDGAIVTVNGNKFQADYQGGDGNDLTLTVVP
jgi:autotransporter-associated beta strand protein